MEIGMRTMRTPQPKARQRGAALVVGLIFLMMLSLMGVAAYTVATQEERMAGNTRDRIRAFEAAEASLRDCEALLGGGSTLPTFDGTNGMYTAPAFGSPQAFETINWVTGSVRVIPTSIPDVARQPRCIIEHVDDIEVKCPTCELSGPLQVIPETIFRVSATGYGASANTTITLQSMYRRQ
jgi:type IV pilus assembly protein PilX